jgi:ankyrin repeat protein
MRVKTGLMKIIYIVLIFMFSSAFLVSCASTRTPLELAANSDDLKEVNELLASGADPCEKVGDHTAFDFAQGDVREVFHREEMKTEIYRALLDRAYQRFVEGKKCENILFYAARIGDAEMIKHLIAKGEDPNEGKEDWESSPLGIAAYYGHEDAVKALVEGGANIDLQIDNLDKTRAHARMIGSTSSYEKTDNAIKMLNKYKEKQK